MKVIGVDLDGIITKVGFYNPSIVLPWPLFFLLVPIILFSKPDAQVVKVCSGSNGKIKIIKDVMAGIVLLASLSMLSLITISQTHLPYF